MTTSLFSFRTASPMSSALRLAATALVAASLAACGPSSPGPGTYADTANLPSPTTPADVLPGAAPDEVTPPPTSSPLPQRAPAAAPRTAQTSTPKPPPIESPAPRQLAQAPAPAVTAPPARARQVEPAGQFGRVTAIQTLRSEAKSNGTGAVIGGVLGGVIGNQIGSGNGRAAATAIGAIGGAVAGNNVEKHRSREVIGYRVSVQLDNGNSRSVTVNSLDGLSKGDRVRYADGHLFRA